MLEVNEIFGPTIQGEGKLVGTPSIFIRFSRCNMRCEGFNVEYKTLDGQIKKSCDTYYAVDPTFKNQWERLDTKNIIKKVSNLEPKSYKIDIVITGGEPLLNWKNKEFQELLKYYVQNGYQVTIETNASMDIDFKEEYQKKILFSMSVKLSNSKEPLKKRVNIKTLTNILNNTKNSYLKFVLDETFLNTAKEEIYSIINQIPKTEIYLMPMGETTKQINKNCQSIIAMAIQNGFKYCDRLHIRVWDNKRGV